MNKVKKFFTDFFTARNMVLTAVFSAMSFVLYIINFKLPFIFPGFLSIDISEAPILLAGFMLGPIGGAIAVVVRFGLKFAYGSSTAGVGETADLILGLTLVLTSSIIYRINRTKKGAVIALLVGVPVTTVVALFLNRFMLVPLFVQLFWGGDWNTLLGMVSTLYNREITRDNFFVFYLILTTIPFNLLRLGICAGITYLLYKRLQKFFDRFGANKKKKSSETSSLDS